MSIPDFVAGDTVRALTVTSNYSVTTSAVMYVPFHQSHHVFLLWFTTRYFGNINGDYIYPANLTPLRYFVYDNYQGTYYRYQPWTNFIGSTVGASVTYTSNARYDATPIPLMIFGIGLECNLLLAGGDTSAQVWINLHYGFTKKKKYVQGYSK